MILGCRQILLIDLKRKITFNLRQFSIKRTKHFIKRTKTCAMLGFLFCLLQLKSALEIGLYTLKGFGKRAFTLKQAQQHCFQPKTAASFFRLFYKSARKDAIPVERVDFWKHWRFSSSPPLPIMKKKIEKRHAVLISSRMVFC